MAKNEKGKKKKIELEAEVWCKYLIKCMNIYAVHIFRYLYVRIQLRS